MAAYAIFIRESVRDQKELEIYAKKAPASMAGHAITPLAVHGRQEVVEGPANGGCRHSPVSFVRRGEGLVRQPGVLRGP